MKEAYVSYETAKLLKEKGFDWECARYYNAQHDEARIVGDTFICNWNDELLMERLMMSGAYSIPTQQMAMRWLREVHNIDISVTPDDGSWWIRITELEYWSCVFDGKVLNSDDIKFAYKGSTSTKEECYEAGLQYVLTKLI